MIPFDTIAEELEYMLRTELVDGVVCFTEDVSDIASFVAGHSDEIIHALRRT